MRIRVQTTQPGGFVEEVECDSYRVQDTQNLWVYSQANRLGDVQIWSHRYGSKVTWVIEELEV